MKYEDLVRILELEKKSTLSRIPPDFFSQVYDYIKELEVAEQKIGRRHSEEAIMIQYELKNALSTIEKIYNKRTRKIIKMASVKAFLKNPPRVDHDTDHMTPEEQDIYNQMLNIILQGKKNTIERILGNEGNETEIRYTPERGPDAEVLKSVKTIPVPAATDMEAQEPAAEEKDVDAVHDVLEEGIHPDHEAAHILLPDTTIPEDTARIHEDISTSDKAPLTGAENRKGKKDLNKEYIVVRVLKDISTFAGSDGRNYTLNAQDVAVLPKVNARALLKRKMAVEIRST